MDTINKTSNMFDILSFDTNVENINELLVSEALRLEKIISFGHLYPDGFGYEQDQNEWVLLIKGFATIGYLDGKR